MKYLYNPPFIIKNIFHHSVWHTKNNKILLTFDDGPVSETTELILKELNKYGIKSIFFCVGNNIKKNQVLFNEILSKGHTIGNHTFNHKILTSLPENEIKKEIDLFNNFVEEKFGYKVEYFRPPHGRMNFKIKRIINQKKIKNIMWSLLTYDYKNDLKIVEKSVKKYLRKDSIIVLHDSLKSKNIILDSIKIIADESAKKGYEIGEPAECLK